MADGARGLWFPLVLLGLWAILVWLAPAERTLGDGIRSVYVHVGLVWAGTAALAIAAAGGLVALGTARTDVDAWVEAAWRGGLAVFGAGIAVSMLAARINWGAVALNEPRMAASLRFVALAVIAQVIAAWYARPRVTGALAAAMFVLLAWDVGGARLVMHPHDPIRAATSSAIQWTFAASFALATALAGWAVVALRAHARAR